MSTAPGRSRAGLLWGIGSWIAVALLGVVANALLLWSFGPSIVGLSF